MYKLHLSYLFKTLEHFNTWFMRFELYAEFEFRIYLLPDFKFMYIHVNRKLTF